MGAHSFTTFITVIALTILATSNQARATQGSINPNGSSQLVRYIPHPPVRESAALKEFVDWTPTAAPELHKGPLEYCNPITVRHQIASSVGSNIPANAKHAIETCLEKWEIRSTMIGNLVEFSTINYDYEKTRSFQYLKIQMPNSKIVRGILGVKPGAKARPIVIATCGVLCNAGDKNSEYLLMKFFDESPFHVLVLGNHTSPAFVEDNGVGGFGGGINAGETLVKLARDLRRPENPLSSKISHVFLYGLSLGGHEVLYASYLHQRMVSMGGVPVIDGIAVNSPVVDFPETIQRLTSRSVIKQVFGIALGGMFKIVSKLVGFDLEAAANHPETKDDEFKINSQLFYANQQAYYERFPATENWEIPKASDANMLLEQTRFQSYAAQTEIPVLAVSSKNDPVVRPYQNALLLEKPELENRYSVVVAKNGSHMGMALAYGWRNMSLAFQGYFLALAPDFYSQMKTYSVNMPNLSNWKPAKYIKKRNAKIVRVDWKAHEGTSRIDLQVTVTGFSPNEPLICQEDITLNTPACTSVLKIKMDIGDFPTPLNIPATKQEAAALTRWLNVQIDITDQDGHSPVDTQKLPAVAKYLEL